MKALNICNAYQVYSTVGMSDIEPIHFLSYPLCGDIMSFDTFSRASIRE